jgi:hypothetical protein
MFLRALQNSDMGFLINKTAKTAIQICFSKIQAARVGAGGDQERANGV